jgi:hypothetical protein
VVIWYIFQRFGFFNLQKSTLKVSSKLGTKPLYVQRRFRILLEILQARANFMKLHLAQKNIRQNFITELCAISSKLRLKNTNGQNSSIEWNLKGPFINFCLIQKKFWPQTTAETDSVESTPVRV